MNLTKKQQVLSVATFLIFLMIIWQVYSMFRTPSDVGSPAKMSVPKAMQQSGAVGGIAQPEKMPNASAAGVSRLEQEAYLRLASEYQLIQMQRMIAEGYAAIAAARLNAAKALAELNKYNVDVGVGSLPGGEGKGEYELIYLGQQGGEWSATLKRGSQTFDVVTGTVLGKGMRVLQIDGNGVVVMRNNKKTLITFNGDTSATDDVLEQEGIEPAGAENSTDVIASEKTKIAEIKKPAVEKPASAPASKSAPAAAVLPVPVAMQQAAVKPEPKAEVKPAPVPMPKPAPAPAAAVPAVQQAVAKPEPKAEVKPAPVPKPAPAAAAAVPAVQQTVAKPEPKVEAKPAPAPAPKPAAALPPAVPAAMQQAAVKPEPTKLDVKSAPAQVPQPAKKAEAASITAPAAKPSEPKKEIQVPQAVKPMPSVPSIEIALLPKTTQANKTDTKTPEPAKPVAAAVTPPAKPLSTPAAAVPALPLASTKKSETPAAPAPVATPPKATTAKLTAAEQAELQALLPPEQAKKANGTGKPAAAPVTPATVAKQEVAPVVKPAPVVEPTKSPVAEVAKAVEAKATTIALAAVSTDKQDVKAKKEEAPAKDKPEVKVKKEETPAKPDTVTASKATTGEAIPSSEAYLLSVKPSAYTIQMIAGEEPSNLFKFIKAHQLDDNAMWYRTTLKGKPWYVLIYGEYPDSAAANKALAELPETMRGWTPFVRKMASVQMSIKQGPAKDTVPEGAPASDVASTAPVTPKVEKIEKAAIAPIPAKIEKSQKTEVTPAPAKPEKKVETPPAVAAPVVKKEEVPVPPAAPATPPAAPAVEKTPALLASKPSANKDTIVATYPSSEKQLLAAKSTNYTIQLIGNADLDVIFKFIQDNHLDKKAMWYRTTRDGKDWYVLVYGQFIDMHEARQAFSDLPSSVRTSTSFIRQLSSIQAAMKQK